MDVSLLVRVDVCVVIRPSSVRSFIRPSGRSSVRPSGCMCVCPSGCMCEYVCLSVCLSVWLCANIMDLGHVVTVHLLASTPPARSPTYPPARSPACSSALPQLKAIQFLCFCVCDFADHRILKNENRRLRQRLTSPTCSYLKPAE